MFTIFYTLSVLAYAAMVGAGLGLAMRVVVSSARGKSKFVIDGIIGAETFAGIYLMSSGTNLIWVTIAAIVGSLCWQIFHVLSE